MQEKKSTFEHSIACHILKGTCTSSALNLFILTWFRPMVRNISNFDLEFEKVVVVLGFYVPPTAKVIRRRDLGLKSHPKDWRSPGSNSGPLVYKAGSLTARPRRLLSLKKDAIKSHISYDIKNLQFAPV